MLGAVVLAILFYVVFPKWLEIQEAGGLETWLKDADGRLAGILIMIAHLVR